VTREDNKRTRRNVSEEDLRKQLPKPAKAAAVKDEMVPYDYETYGYQAKLDGTPTAGYALWVLHNEGYTDDQIYGRSTDAKEKRKPKPEFQALMNHIIKRDKGLADKTIGRSNLTSNDTTEVVKVDEKPAKKANKAKKDTKKSVTIPVIHSFFGSKR
jgi:SOS response regulatory protein OraA/RecX